MCFSAVLTAFAAHCPKLHAPLYAAEKPPRAFHSPKKSKSSFPACFSPAGRDIGFNYGQSAKAQAWFPAQRVHTGPKRRSAGLSGVLRRLNPNRPALSKQTVRRTWPV